MKIDTCNLYTPDVIIENARLQHTDKIEQISRFDVPDRPKALNSVVPGFVDTHIHGCVGKDFSDTDHNGLKKIEQYLYTRGVTTVLATTLSIPFERISKILDSIRDYMEKNPKTSIAGVHLEGPFLNVEKKGAQNPDFIKIPTDKEIEIILQNKDIVKVITLAPETVGTDLIELLSKNGITCSIGHTCANYRQSVEALKAGATRFTHLFNAMNPIHHRDLNATGAGLLCDAYVEIICDMVHLSKEAIKLVFRNKDSDKIIFISDAMEATGLKPGKYKLGGLEVEVNENSARLMDGTLAGSVLNLDQALRNVTQALRLPFHDVLKCLTKNPSISSGLDCGTLEIGKNADFVILDENNMVIRTVKLGETVYENTD